MECHWCSSARSMENAEPNLPNPTLLSRSKGPISKLEMLLLEIDSRESERRKSEITNAMNAETLFVYGYDPDLEPDYEFQFESEKKIHCKFADIAW
jgi:hypothetical protein